MDNWKDKVKQSQAAIIDSLAECEMLMSELYRAYAAALPEGQATWNGLAKEEEQHAAVLTSLKKILEGGSLFRELGRFNEDKVTPVKKMLRTAIDAARSGRITEREARTTAVAVETSLLDSHFYDTVTSDSPEYCKVAQAMISGTKQHLERLRNKLMSAAD